MKRCLWVLLPLALAGPGCMMFDGAGWRDQPPPAVKAPAAPPPAVLPEEVNAANALEKAHALQAELDYDATQRPLPSAPAPAPARSETRP